MLLSIVVFVLVLSILIIVHEFGHFIVAKRAGVWVEEFGIGYPPRIFGKKIGETTYSLNLLPIGGFVRLHGEQEEEGVTKPKRAFLNKSKKVKSAILIAGVAMNLMLAIAAFSISYTFSGVPRQTDKVIISDIAPNSPADTAGLKPEDVVLSVDGSKVTSVNDFINKIEVKKGQEVRLNIQEKGENIKDLSLTPRADPPAGEGPLGVAVTQTEIYFPPIWQRPFYGVYFGFKESLFWGKAIAGALGGIVTSLFKGSLPTDITGPVGIFAVTSEVSKFGILAIINFLGIFSLNLAIVNILPFPALDGGRLLFVVIEGITGKKVLPRVEATIHTVGMAVLILFLIAITISDIRRLVAAGGSISGFLQSAVK